MRPAGEPMSHADRYTVDPIEEKVAKAFVLQHHYSGSYPAAVFRAGLFRHERFQKPLLCGVAVFSVPCNQRVVPKYTNLEPNEGIELGRFVLLDEEPGNTESFFLARAMKLLRIAKPHIRAVISYSDPIPRRSLDGKIILPGHLGIIYQSSNATHFGRSSARTLKLLPSGEVVSDRALSKLRSKSRGWEYAERQLVAAGALPRLHWEHPRDWLERLIETPNFIRKVRHPGNYAYGFALGGRLEKKFLLQDFAAPLPYPKAA